MNGAHNFSDVTLLVTHYNRSNSLKRLLQSFQDQNYVFGEVVVSDDGSTPDQIEKLTELQQEFNFRLVTAPVNKGLGNNINKGQDAVKTPFTLYVQEDFVPKPIFVEKFPRALSFLKERNEIDIVRFYAYFKYPHLKPFKDGFSEMVFKKTNLITTYNKFYYYSDHPHLRRSSFLEKFGRYAEGVKGDVTEYRMMMSFLKNGGRGLYYDEFKGLFDQVNTYEEPSTMKRNFWRENEMLPVKLMRHLYRHFRFNYDLFFNRLN